MAITYNTIPQTYSPSDNPLLYVFESDQTGQANFSFKIETILDGTVVSEDRVFPERSNVAHWDASHIVKDLMNLPRVTGALITDMDTISTLQIRVTESYGDPIADGANLLSTITNTFKASVEQDQFESVDWFLDYANTKWFTDVPNLSNIVIKGQDVICAMLSDSAQDYTIRFYDSAGGLLDTYINNQNNALVQFNLNDANLAAVYGGIDFNDVASFTIQVGTSEVLSFTYLIEYCWGIHSMLWVNNYGTYDQYLAEHNNREKVTLEGMQYRKPYGQWNGTDFVYNQQNAGYRDFVKSKKRKGELITEYMTAEVQNWLVGIYESPQHFLYDPSGILFPFRVTNTSYELKQARFDELISEVITYEAGITKNSIKL